MNGLPKVSVAVITYNQEKFIRETLDSVVLQDYENIEIIVADDGSKDGTANIIKEYAEKYPNLFKIILADTNAGIAENCNRAFFACTGKYIAWLGGDDLFYSGKISSQVEAMESDEDCDLSYHAVRVFNSDSGETIGITNLEDKKRRNLQELLWNGISLPGSSVMLRRSSCPVTGFNLNIPRANDWLFYTETMLYGYAVRVEDVLGAYRIHDNNVTRTSLVDDMQKTFARLRLMRPDLRRAVARAEAIAYFHEGRKSLNAGDRSTAHALFLRGVKLDYTFLPVWSWLILSSLSNGQRRELTNLYKRVKGLI